MITANMFTKDSNADIALNVGRLEFSKPFAKAKTAPGSTYIDDNATPFVNAYWLGWIRPENTPTALKMSSRHYDSGSDKLTSYDSTLLQNYNITYFADCYAQNDYAFYNNQAGAIYKYKNTSESIPEKWKAAPEADQFALRSKRMINHFYIGVVNFSCMRITYTAIKRQSHDIGEDWTWYNTIIDKNAEDFENWKIGTQQITIDGETVTIDNRELNENYYTTVTVNGNEYDVAITAYVAIQDNSCDSNDTTFNRCRIFPAIDLYATGQASTVEPIDTPYEIIFGALGSPYTRFQENDYVPNMDYMKTFDQHNTYYYYNVNRLQGNGGGTNGDCQEIIDRNSGVVDLLSVLPGCYDFEFPDSVATSNDSNIYGVPMGFYFVGNSIMYLLSGYMRYARMFTPIDIIHHMSLMPRWKAKRTDPPSYGVIDGIYYPEVLDSGEFTGRLITGTRTELLHRLQFWQYDEITENDYSGDDLPPYEPPEPGEPGENIGDTITRPGSLGIGGTTDFITQYSMTATQISELGQVLWTSIFTADYWKNFMFSLALDTGSINVSAILNFFISLRFYPFSLANLDSYTNIGQDMYIGSGMMPLHFANDLYTIDEYAEYIKGGECTVWSSNFYGDWRDYVNTEITLYIPYCGTVQLNPADVVHNKIEVEYAIDFATGACIAYVDLKTGDGAGYPIAALPGQIGADIPLTATVAGQVAARLAGDAMNIAGLIGGSASNQLGSEIGAATGAMTGKAAPTAGSVGFALGGPLGAAAGFALGSAAGAAPGIAGTAINVLQRGGVQAPMLGGARGFASFGAPQKPYVQIRRGIYPDIDNYNDVVGTPAPSTAVIEDCTGLIKGDIITAGLAVQAEEAEAIRAAVSNGIIV